MISLIFSFIFFIVFIILCIVGGNHLLRSMVDSVLNDNENFKNFNDEDVINPTDECKKNDIKAQNTLNFQTATNIPLSPTNYSNFVGKIYTDYEMNTQNEELQKGKYCLKKSKLLYDGIWDPIINKNNDFEQESWNLTNGDLYDGYYCSDKLIQVNKPLPKNYIDESATPPIKDGDYYTYFNDLVDDKYDIELSCFPEIFNKGIY